MDFDWDDDKAISNLAKHGVAFETAKEVFSDPNALIEVDHSSFDEERWRNIGLGGGDVLFIVHTERDDGDIVRIISARRATKNEQNRYYRQALP